MLAKTYQVLIVEDDFRVANINRQFVEKVEGFSVAGVARTGEEALQLIEELQVNLVLLDVFIPDLSGLEILWKIREKYREIDVIMITAAKEVQSIEEALRGGAIDYMIKPIDFARFETTLLRYYGTRKLMEDREEMDQNEVDRLWGIRGTVQKIEPTTIPKGIDPITLTKVLEEINRSKLEGLTAVELGHLLGTSRTTSRRYLEYMVSVGQVKAELKYGEVGRPERRYFNR
jgi:response regulator of citrate/malate metabolism